MTYNMTARRTSQLSSPSRHWLPIYRWKKLVAMRRLATD